MLLTKVLFTATLSGIENKYFSETIGEYRYSFQKEILTGDYYMVEPQTNIMNTTKDFSQDI